VYSQCVRLLYYHKTAKQQEGNHLGGGASHQRNFCMFFACVNNRMSTCLSFSLDIHDPLAMFACVKN
jgi:hypothetical protein